MPTNYTENCLVEIAKTASLKSGLNIRYVSGCDVAVGWMGHHVHPLQELETIHQKVARDAAHRHLPASQAQRDAEQHALDQFFAFQSTDPVPIPVNGQKVEDSSPIARFQKAVLRLDAVKRGLLFDSLAVSNNPTVLNKFRQRLQLLIEEAEELQSTFWNIPEVNHPIGVVDVPLLQEVFANIQNARGNLPGAVAATVATLNASVTFLETNVFDLLEEAFNSPAKITMIYTIEPFYLFRLYVPFRIESETGTSLSERQKASGILTGLMNDPVGNMAWVSVWLEAKVLELDEALRQFDPNQDNIFFHLKGGRAQAYLLGNPRGGTNDWDTGIIINPHLPAEFWHEVFSEVHNIVLTKFRKFKQELLVYMHGQADEIAIEMQLNRDHQVNDAHTPDEGLDDDEYIRTLDESSQLADAIWAADGPSNIKAELIDIGIPRRNSVEALEHWEHTRPHIQRQLNGVPIPGALYFADEYMQMTRESFAGISPAPHKTGKRIKRFREILNTVSMDGDITIKRNDLELAGLIPLSLTAVDEETPGPVISRLVVLGLDQFNEAYKLNLEPGMAPLFDLEFYNIAMNIEDLSTRDEEFGIRDLPAADQQYSRELIRWISVIVRVSDLFEKHFKDRAEFFGFGTNPPTPAQTTRRRTLETFVKALYTATVFSEDDDDMRSQFQLAVSSSFATLLHVEYGGITSTVKETLDPVARIDLTVFCRDNSVDPDVVREALINPAIERFIANPLNPMFNAQTGDNGAIDIFWPQEETMGDFQYHPLIIRITVNTQIWPQLSFVRGFPVISIRDLIREYDVRSAHAKEFGTVQRLKKNNSVLCTLMTQFDY